LAVTGQQTGVPERTNHYVVRATAATVHWGYFSRSLKPVLSVESGDFVTIETLTHHAYDDYARMIEGDPGAESVFHWTKEAKNVDRRGAGPIDASIHGRGAGEGFGVHICTGPIFVRDAEPGDVLEVRILDVRTRACCNPAFHGRAFGSNAAAWWGFQYNDLLTEPKPREVITIYEIDATEERNWARAVYNYRWVPQTDPFGVVHRIIDYPGVPVDHALVEEKHDILKDVRIPVRPHFGVIALAPREAEFVDSVPPGYFGGNVDDWRIGKGAVMYYPVAVPGALFSVGDPHASQGDSELCGTAIECSLNGTFQLILHKRQHLAETPLAELDYPLLETQDEWVVHGFSFPNYLAELGDNSQSEIFAKSSLDRAMRDAFRKMRHFLMTAKGLTEDEAISLMSVAVDFGVTQVVDANWGIHAILKKSMFAGEPG
jgi:acetamidase/formamidase